MVSRLTRDLLTLDLSWNKALCPQRHESEGMVLFTVLVTH